MHADNDQVTFPQAVNRRIQDKTFNWYPQLFTCLYTKITVTVFPGYNSQIHLFAYITANYWFERKQDLYRRTKGLTVEVLDQ